MNQLVSAVKSLAASIQSLASYYGTYSSISGSSWQMRGTVIEREYEVLDDDGSLTTVKSTDWLFLNSDLRDGGQGATPQPGDTWEPDDYAIDQDSPDYQATYEAMLLGNKPCFQPHDDSGVLTIVHMKRVASGG